MPIKDMFLIMTIITMCYIQHFVHSSSLTITTTLKSRHYYYFLAEETEVQKASVITRDYGACTWDQDVIKGLCV